MKQKLVSISTLDYYITTFSSTIGITYKCLYIKIIHQSRVSIHDELEEPEALGDVTGNKGKSRGSDPLGVFDGDGCK